MIITLQSTTQQNNSWITHLTIRLSPHFDQNLPLKKQQLETIL